MKRDQTKMVIAGRCWPGEERTGEGRMMNRQRRREGNRVKRRALRCTAAAMAILVLALQPCFSFPSLASSFGSGYPSWDDPEYNSYSYWDEEAKRKIVNVTRTYDDGTQNISEYRYDAQGNLVYSDVKTTDGSRVTVNRVYSGDNLISTTAYQRDAGSKIELTETNDYSEEGYLIHTLSVSRDAGKSRSEELWCLGRDMPLKRVTTGWDGITTQTDYMYNEQGELYSYRETSSDGSISQTEYRFDGNGETVYRKEYEYDPDYQLAHTEEYNFEGQVTHLLATWAYADGRVKTEEQWYENYWEPIKKVTTDENGTQTTENYTYDADGNETLYTKVKSDGTSQKRQTVYSHNRTERTYTDSLGNSVVEINTNDNQGSSIREYTEKNADGSSRYTKRVYQDYSTVSYEDRSIGADGTETYEISTYNEDGSVSTQEKSADGSITETHTDALGNATVNKVLSDGIKAEVTDVRDEAGRRVAQITRYSDGGEDRIDYGYDADGDVIAETETRRNGVSAVTQYQYSDKSSYTGTFTQTFSNGLQLAWTVEPIDEDTRQIVVNYSGGDVVQDTVIEKDYESLYVKTVYRDGRTEESIHDLSGDSVWDVRYEILLPLQERMDNYIEQCWNILP